MDEWTLAQSQPSDQLARLEYFSMKKVQDGREIEFVITVQERIVGEDKSMRFFAQADKQTNQKTAPYYPTGWGSTLIDALSECIKAVHLFRYERDDLAE